MTPACTVIVRSTVLISSILFSRSSEMTTSSGGRQRAADETGQAAMRNHALAVRMTQRERFADAWPCRAARTTHRASRDAFAAPDAGRAIVHVGATNTVSSPSAPRKAATTSAMIFPSR
jgi:hypothetical protein